MHSAIAGDWHACAVQCQYSVKCVPHGRNAVQGFSTICDVRVNQASELFLFGKRFRLSLKILDSITSSR